MKFEGIKFNIMFTISDIVIFTLWESNYGHFGTIFAQFWPIIYEMSGMLHLNLSLTVKYQLILSLYVVWGY